jgi:type IV pilus biogenesis protein CpaD/CtpE
MTKSTWMRLGVCMLAAVAMIAMLEGCAKKEKAAETTTTENTETTPPAANTAAAGTYTAAMANGTTSLMLNTDMSASLSLQPVAGAPAQVENGTWANGATANDVAVTFSKSPVDTTMSLTLNFTATGDTLALTNGDAVGMAGLKLVKQH